MRGVFFFSSRRRHTRCGRDWSSDVCSSDLGVGEDPPAKIASYSDEYGQKVPTLSEPSPYEISDAYGLETVPSLVLVDDDGTIRDAVESWDREGWNSLAEAAGVPPVSDENDGLPPFRPG